MFFMLLLTKAMIVYVNSVSIKINDSPKDKSSNSNLIHENHINRYSKTICFHSNQAGERGTEIALFDYAFYARKLYGFRSLIFFPSRILGMGNERLRLSLYNFQLNFPVIIYNANNSLIGGPDLARKSWDSGCNVLYVIKSGVRQSEPEFPMSFNLNIPTAIHAVFQWEPHGSAYAAISTKFGLKLNPVVVPHIVNIPSINEFDNQSIREKYHIPSTALVLCRHGGYDTFDIRFVRESVNELIALYPQLFFIFMNTNPALMKMSLGTGQIHFLNASTDKKKINSFISACDVMLHARNDGETFGLAIAEFSIHNKPVITYNNSKDREHIVILGNKGFYYKDKSDLKLVVESFIFSGIPKADYNAYRNFSPKKVMQKFKQTFIDPLIVSNRPVDSQKVEKKAE
jgi:hypothetical protein